jgi:hypothetical protein
MVADHINKNIGKLSVAYCVSIVLTIISLAIFFSGIQVFGPLSDLLGGVSGILLLVVIWQLHKVINSDNNRKSFFLLISALLGTLFLIYGSIQVATGETNWKIGGLWVSQGYGLIGLWFIGNMAKIGNRFKFKRSMRYLGYVAGLSLTIGIFGLLPGFSLVSINSLISNIVIGSTGVNWLLTSLWSYSLSRYIR